METCRRCKRLIGVVGSGSCLEQVVFRPLLFMRKRAFYALMHANLQGKAFKSRFRILPQMLHLQKNRKR